MEYLAESCDAGIAIVPSAAVSISTHIAPVMEGPGMISSLADNGLEKGQFNWFDK
jgi:hypothetical protein